MSLVALMAMGSAANAEVLSVTYKAGEVRSAMGTTEVTVITTLLTVGELKYAEGAGDALLLVSTSSNKVLMTMTLNLAVADDVTSADNIVHELTSADWALLDERDATMAQSMRSQNITSVSLLFRAGIATEDVNIEIADGASITGFTQLQSYCLTVLTTLSVLTQQIDGTQMVYVRSGKPLFYMSGDSPAAAVFRLCDNVNEDDNFTYVLTTDDRTHLDGIELPGTGGKTLGELLEDVASITMTFVGGAPSTFDPYTTPLTFEALEDETTISIDNKLGKTIEYSTNGGSTWSSTSATSIAINGISAGTKVCLRGNNAAYGTLSGSATTINFNKDCYVYGNVMSLISSTGFATLTTLTGDAAFYKLFNNNVHFVSHNTKDLVLPATTLTQSCYSGMFASSTISRAPELPATTIARSCYYSMFTYCKNLTAAPALPATKMEQDCYHAMFEGCTALTEAPALPATELDWNCYENMFRSTGLTEGPALPATELAPGCYEGMFWECKSLVKAPALPATTLAKRCYTLMFYMCSSLVNAPELPATTLESNCYSSMFYGCTSMEKAPVLSAPVLVTACYSYMFSYCTKLNYVKCLAMDLSANSNDSEWMRGTYQWLDGVAATGTFVKAEGVTGWTVGVDGIPTGWTVEEATGIHSIENGQSIMDNVIYDLSGRRVVNATNGIYVINGKKVIVRDNR